MKKGTKIAIGVGAIVGVIIVGALIYKVVTKTTSEKGMDVEVPPVSDGLDQTDFFNQDRLDAMKRLQQRTTRRIIQTRLAKTGSTK